MNRLFLNLYIAATAVEIFARAGNRMDWEVFSKPVLMPLLALSFWLGLRNLTEGTRKQGRKLTVWVMLALFFSWWGDVFLMCSGDLPATFCPTGLDPEMAFLMGLSAFLIGHLCWIGAFVSGPFVSEKGNTGWIIPAVLGLYGVGLITWLWPELGEMLIPVIIYALTICTMAIVAGRRSGRVSPLSFQWTLAGALIFVVSDSVIAINRFALPFQESGVIIMLTYCLAQLLIVYGLYEQLRSSSLSD